MESGARPPCRAGWRRSACDIGEHEAGWAGPTDNVLELPFRATGQVPLGDGRVNAQRPATGNIYACLSYLFDGALPDADLVVGMLVHLFDPTATNRPFLFSTTPLRTDAAGRGRASVAIRGEEVPLNVRGAAHALRWEVTHEGRLVYRSGCTVVTLD